MIKNLSFTTKIGLVASLMVLALFGCIDKNNSTNNALVLATYTYSTNDRVDNLRPRSKVLERLLKRPVRIKSYPDVMSFIGGIHSNEVDIGFINTFGYLLLSMDNMNMQAIATLRIEERAMHNYKTVLLTNNKDVSDLVALKTNSEKLSMTFVSEGSTSGNFIPRLYLSSLGIQSPEKEFKEVRYGGNHAATFAELTNGETDVCAIGSNEYFQQLQKDTTLMQSTKVLWMSEEIPLGPVLVHNTVPHSDKEKIKRLLVNLNRSNPKAYEAIKAGWSEAKQTDGFYPISDGYYDDFREMNGNATNLSDVLELVKTHYAKNKVNH